MEILGGHDRSSDILVGSYYNLDRVALSATEEEIR